jgi:serine/threonine protein kinase
LVIGDFGASKSLDEIKTTNTIIGSWNYISPEILNNIKPTVLTDIW